MILLDTCTLLWLELQPAKLSENCRSILEYRTGPTFVSAISAFEIGQKHAAGKLDLPLSPAIWLEHMCLVHDLIAIPVTVAHSFVAAQLPPHHRDPFDRLLIATAQVQHLTLLTPDPLIHLYEEASIVW